jgi:hypothetical protein
MACRSRQTRAILSVLVAALPISVVACEMTDVRYQGTKLDRPIVPVTSIEVIRKGTPTAPSRNLGIVTVTCPSEGEAAWFDNPNTLPGCSYERAEWLAAAKAAGIGANGIHSIVAGMNSVGTVESLRATAFYYLPDGAAKRPAPETAAPSGK